jgi:hypothetical protein
MANIAGYARHKGGGIGRFGGAPEPTTYQGDVQSGEFEDRRSNRSETLPGMKVGDRTEQDFDQAMAETRKTLRTQQEIKETEEDVAAIAARITDQKLGLKREQPHSDREIAQAKKVLGDLGYAVPKSSRPGEVSPSGIGSHANG